jgi:hypothetical protein
LILISLILGFQAIWISDPFPSTSDPKYTFAKKTFQLISFFRIYFVAGVSFIFVLYSVTFHFYRKLGSWVQTTSSMMTMTSQTEETLTATRGLMRMMKWLLFQPVVFLYPALVMETLLRIFPGFISVRTARLFLITGPLPQIFNPIITMFFVKRYSVTVSHLLPRGSVNVKSFPAVHPIPSSHVWAED